MSSESESSVATPVEKRIIVVRHAESTFNAGGSMEKNCGLTEFGRDSCKHLTFDVDLVVCSTLKRARETLDNSGIVYRDIIFSDLCREICDSNPVNHYNGEAVHSETPEEIKQRLSDFREELRELNEVYDTICVITHYSFLKELTGFSFQNCFYCNFSIKDL